MGYTPNPDAAPQWLRDIAAALNGGGTGFANTVVVPKAVTFTGAAGAGAIGTINLFTVTGQVLMAIIGVSGTTPVGTGATIKVGNSTTTTRYLASETATNLVAGDTQDITGIVSAGTAPVTTPNQLGANTEVVIATIATANITAGQITYYLFYKPLSAGASVVAN